MKCSICGRDSAPGAKLCDDCRSARKRAFAATVTQPLLEAAGTRRSRASTRLLKPSQSMTMSARRASRKAKVESVGEASAPARRNWVPMVLAALALALIAGTYGAYRMRSHDVPEPGSEAGAPAQSASPAVPSPPVTAPSAGVQSTSPPDAKANSDAGPSAAPHPPEATKKSTVKAKVAPPPVGVAVQAPEPPPPEVDVTPAPPPAVAKPAPRVDPWQPLNDALATCDREEVSARIRCEQGARQRYCQGNWGVAAQCPIGPNPDAQ
jgi:hypothetical protein